MPIIFGWGKQTVKQIGVVFKHLCNHCKNEEFWILQRTTTWFSLFFIPIFPYSTKYFLMCPICKYGLTLNQEQVGQFRPLAEINQLLIDGVITTEEHQVRINRLNSNYRIPITAETAETKILPAATTKPNNCVKCGNKTGENEKFCGRCGAQVAIK